MAGRRRIGDGVVGWMGDFGDRPGMPSPTLPKSTPPHLLFGSAVTLEMQVWVAPRTPYSK